MPIYEPYLIFIAISLLSFFIALIVRLNYKRERQVVGGKKLKIILVIIVLGYLIKLFLGWKLSNWYVQTLILLSLFVYLDYLIIVKKHPIKLLVYYSLIRIYSFGLPIIGFVLSLIIILLTAGYGGGALECVIFPQDSSYGEQKVYKNLYIYSNECTHDFTFKKKFLVFEKDVAKITGRYNNIFAEYRDSEIDPITGYINQKENIIYITGRNRHNHYIKLTILDNRIIQVEVIRPLSSHMLSGEDIQLESYEKQLIKL